MYGMEYYNSWFIYVLPPMILALYAQFKIKTSFNKYSRVYNGNGYTGAEIARMILDRNGLTDVKITRAKGTLTDHYDPRTRIIRLSGPIHDGNSIASMSVAAHEVGHALQHAQGYYPLIIRNTIAPVAALGSNLVWAFIFLGMVIYPFFIELGIALFLGVVAFQIITLPVEINASRRALDQLENGFATKETLRPSREVLKAAALTYIAATLVALGELMRILAITDNNRNRK